MSNLKQELIDLMNKANNNNTIVRYHPEMYWDAIERMMRAAASKGESYVSIHLTTDLGIANDLSVIEMKTWTKFINEKGVVPLVGKGHLSIGWANSHV